MEHFFDGLNKDIASIRLEGYGVDSDYLDKYSTNGVVFCFIKRILWVFSTKKSYFLTEYSLINNLIEDVEQDDVEQDDESEIEL